MIACKLLVRLLPDCRRGLFVKQLIDIENSFQFQVGPVIEWVTERMRYRTSPGEKFVVGISVSRTERFIDTTGPHGAPFIMVARKPNFEQVIEATVARNIPGAEVTVVVKNWLLASVGMVQVASSLVTEEKIIVNKGHRVYPRRGSF